MSAPAGYPTRPYSSLTVGGLFPLTDPGDWSDAAMQHRQKAASLLESANAIRSAADGVPAEGQSGHTVDGFTDASHRLAQTVMAHADEYFTMAGAADEVGRLIGGLREDLDNIDREANEQIQQVLSSGGGAFSAGAKAAMLSAIVAQARADATAKTTAASGAIGKEGFKLTGSDGTTQALGGGTNGAAPPSPRTSPDDTIVGPRSGPSFAPASNGPHGGPQPQTGPGGAPPPIPGDRVLDRGLGASGGRQGAPNSAPAAAAGARSPAPADAVRDWQPADVPTPPLTSLPGGGGLPGGLGGGGLPGGLPGGLGGGGVPASGLGNFSPASSLSPASSVASPANFTQGLGSGLGSAPATPMMPPVPPSEPLGSGGAPNAGFVPGPAPVSAASGAPAAPPATPAAAAAAPASGATAMPAAMGPLPPFGSDIPRPAAAAAAASVIPASGAPTAAPSSPVISSAAAPVAPLPPGVVGSGVGAAAGAGAEAIRSAMPDALLAAAVKLVYQLLHDSRLYPFLDWCVGVFKTPSGVETVVVSSEGVGYIPVGVFVPRNVRLLFSDPGLGNDFKARWFGWANPTQTMLAYARLLAEANPNITLHALAVSTSQGGSSLPAHDAGVAVIEDCSLLTSPIPLDAPGSKLDESRRHRLETFDAALYTRLTDVGGSTPPDRSQTWKATVAAVVRVLDRAGALQDLAVPPVIRGVLQGLVAGEGVPEDRWSALEMEHLLAAANAASHRPGRMLDSEGASPYARAHHNLARVTTLLSLWRDTTPKYPEIEYEIRQIDLEGELWPAGGGG
jgi:hypothetical protein